MSNLEPPKYLTDALAEKAVVIGMSPERLMMLLKIEEPVYNQLITGDFTPSPYVLDALMKLFVILGIREANPKTLIGSDDAEMANWIAHHNGEVIALCNLLDTRWRVFVQASHEQTRKVFKIGVWSFFAMLMVALTLYFATASMRRIPDTLLVAYVLSLIATAIAALTVLFSAAENAVYKSRFRAMKW